MAGNKPPPPPSSARPPAPTISLSPRSSIEGLFTGGPEASPGPMTLVSSFFAENDSENDFRSFSQLLAGAMSPVAVPDIRKSFAQREAVESDGGSGEFRFQQNKPTGLMVSQAQGMFTIPPGLSPATLFDSPGFFSSSQGIFGFPNQQFPNQITSQAQAQAQPQPIPSNAYLQQKKPHINDSHSDYKSQPPNIAIDKPTNDGYNWRKYGQKHVKGSEYPRSYYKCSHPNCPVKKKIERSFEGQITEIIYKGQHNHSPPTKRTKDNVNNSDGNSDFAQNKPKDQFFSYLSSTKDQESSQITPENNIYGSSDSDEVGDAETRVNRRDEDEPESKRRNIEIQTSEQASDHRSVTEPRIIVQTTSEVDLLDDGFRWRKYGQKVVKGNSYPRSYYKCTSPGCNVRKHIERAASDPKAVVTTYEGKHNHDVPAAKNSSHNTTSSASNFRPSNTVIDRQMGNRRNEFGDNEQPPVALLQFKEERIT